MAEENVLSYRKLEEVKIVFGGLRQLRNNNSKESREEILDAVLKFKNKTFALLKRKQGFYHF